MWSQAPYIFRQLTFIKSLFNFAGFDCNSILLPAEPVGALAPGKEGVCNAYLPTSSTLARFFWVVRLYARNGFVVIIDDHTGDATLKSDYGAWLGVHLYTPPLLLFTLGFIELSELLEK